jgi:hypothetical protein
MKAKAAQIPQDEEQAIPIQHQHLNVVSGRSSPGWLTYCSIAFAMILMFIFGMAVATFFYSFKPGNAHSQYTSCTPPCAASPDRAINNKPHEGTCTAAASHRFRPDDSVALDAHRTHLANVSLDMLLEASHRIRSHTTQPLQLDLSPVCAIFEKALQLGGLRGVMTSFLETHTFKAAFDKAAQARFLPVKTSIEDHRHDNDVTIHYEADFVSTSYLDGSLYSLRHWLGMFLAEKIFEGPISLHGEVHEHRGGYANKTVDLMRELNGALEAPGAYESNMNSMVHGVSWHLVALTMESEPTFEQYPLDLARKLCTEDVMDTDRFQGADPSDLPHPEKDGFFQAACLHAFGHGVYYALAYKELSMKASACKPLYPHGYTMSQETATLADRICNTAPDPERNMCLHGLRHSLSLR